MEKPVVSIISKEVCGRWEWKGGYLDLTREEETAKEYVTSKYNKTKQNKI